MMKEIHICGRFDGGTRVWIFVLGCGAGSKICGSGSKSQEA